MLCVLGGFAFGAVFGTLIGDLSYCETKGNEYVRNGSGVVAQR